MDNGVSGMGKVIVRVWQSGTGIDGKLKSMGHVSLQTSGGANGEGCYISFWPQNAIKSPFFDHNRAPHFMTEYEEDVEAQGRECDSETTLKSLDVNAINIAYKAFVNSGCRWDVWGSSFFIDDPKTRNCAGLASYLLVRGGIEKLIKYHDEHLAGDVGAVAGVGGGVVMGGLAVGTIATSSSTTLATAAILGGPFTLVFAAVGFLAAGAVGAVAGGTVGTVANVADRIKHIVTPEGVANLANYAREAEIAQPTHAASKCGNMKKY